MYAAVAARTPVPNSLRRRRPSTAELLTVDCNSPRNQ
ncbi:hypothetical protein SPAB_03390 [Salmonella enterica subsp. enterica serovar Paratyphi B str. SPB7]|uniref:Uncharacterized protein n=1 Tax=Salmonella paratyphi B (strain ATCC BAA-1250 / SPB7) TaxID=1016998 RepID=A0A6C6Z6A8_SALPB|nr:hypothetical protein SPAB_03390 [Salmonella enterica subsp. enterica serovar Paratyphi B str. SPB7]